MFSNIPINLLSETQLGGCTALSCILGRRSEQRGVEAGCGGMWSWHLFQQGGKSLSKSDSRTLRIWTRAGWIWPQSTLVGFVHWCKERACVYWWVAHRWPSLFMHLSNSGTPLQGPLSHILTSALTLVFILCLYQHSSSAWINSICWFFVFNCRVHEFVW